MATIWFTADHHFAHKNIVELCERPFKSAEEMDQTMVKAWCDRVRRADTVYHLGDFVWGTKAGLVGRLLDCLPGRIHLILGNHDRAAKKIAHRFESVKFYNEIQIDGIPIVMFHFPIRSWARKHYGAWHLHGHSHGRGAEAEFGKIQDVGVDCWDWGPVSFETLRERMKDR